MPDLRLSPPVVARARNERDETWPDALENAAGAHVAEMGESVERLAAFRLAPLAQRAVMRVDGMNDVF